MSQVYATAINCMDGRAQKPVFDFMRDEFGVDYVDMITEPGPNKILAEGSRADLLDSLKARVAIFVERHGSKIIAIAGHHDCAGNPVGQEEQIAQLRKSAEVVGAWNFRFSKIICLWINKDFKPILF